MVSDPSADVPHLLIADVLSDIGTFMQSVSAAWLMVSFGAGPLRANLALDPDFSGWKRLTSAIFWAGSF